MLNFRGVCVVFPDVLLLVGVNNTWYHPEIIRHHRSRYEAGVGNELEKKMREDEERLRPEKWKSLSSEDDFFSRKKQQFWDRAFSSRRLK